MGATDDRRAWLGIDVGTSGVRAVAIDADKGMLASESEPLPAPLAPGGGAKLQDPAIWRAAMAAVLGRLLPRLGGRVAGIAIDGTSGTLLLADAEGRPLAPASMYDDSSAGHLTARIAGAAPPESGAHGATSPLARLLAAQAGQPGARFALHQADWLAGLLLGRFGTSDENNALKLGYDPVARRWPDFVTALGVRASLLPEVVAPGTALGRAQGELARGLGLDPACRVVAGTTDGCASFLATGASLPGDGVTALGTATTIKLLSDRPIFAPAQGVYSHRMGDVWLAGGSSNAGGAALLRFFGRERIEELTPRLLPDQPTGLAWHPLPGRGERFPVMDPELTFEAEPLPEDDRVLLQGLLEGIAAVEARAYRLLEELGGPRLRSVRSLGGGAGNPAWSRVRALRLGVPMMSPTSGEAAYGTALLALRGAPA